MPHSHKKKTFAVKCCLAVGLLAIAAAIGVLFGPSALVLAQGPTRIDPLADNDVGVLQGKYLEADLDTLVGCYAETARAGTSCPSIRPARRFTSVLNCLRANWRTQTPLWRTPSAWSMMRTAATAGTAPG